MKGFYHLVSGERKLAPKQHPLFSEKVVNGRVILSDAETVSKPEIIVGPRFFLWTLSVEL
jgi:hypothetical protein